METEADVRYALEDLPMPLTLRPASPMSEDELLRFCSANKGYQIEREPDGSLVIDAPKGPFASFRIGNFIGEFAPWAKEDDGGGLVFINLGVVLPDGSMRSPDVAWLSRERWERLTHEEREQFLRIIPEFVVEIRCWTDSEAALETKMRRWMDAGVQLGWAIDPEQKLVTTYSAGQEPKTLLDPEYLEGEGPIAGFRLKIAKFWE